MNTFSRPHYADSTRQPLLTLVPDTATRILDVGCNTGAFGSAIKLLRPTEIWGIEPDPLAAQVAQTRLDHVVIDFFTSTNPIPDGYFDLVTFNDSLEHMSDPATALALARQKINAKGAVQCCVPNMLHVENLEHLLIEKDWQYTEQGVPDRTHLRFFTRKSICRLFEETGYRVQKIEFINEDWWQREKLARRMLFRLFDKFTSEMKYTQIVVMATPLT